MEDVDPEYAHDMRRKCYVAIPGEAKLGVISFGIPGYFAADLAEFEPQTPAQAIELAREMNRQLDVPQEVEDAMMAGSMFGWHQKAAEPAWLFFAQTVGGVH